MALHLNDVNDDIIRKTKLDINNPVFFILAIDMFRISFITIEFSQNYTVPNQVKI